MSSGVFVRAQALTFGELSLILQITIQFHTILVITSQCNLSCICQSPLHCHSVYICYCNAQCTSPLALLVIKAKPHPRCSQNSAADKP